MEASAGIVRAYTWRKRISLIVLFVFSLFAVYPTLAAPVDWIASQQQTDGRYSSATDLATSFQATAESLVSFSALNQTTHPSVPAALQYLSTESFHSTENLTRKILVLERYGMDVSVLVPELKAMQNQDGGFGELFAYDSTVLDTAFALQALAQVQDQSGITLNAINYLLAQQQADGGWRNGQNISSVYVTALTVSALSSYVSRIPAANTAMSKGLQYLLAQRSTNGLWGSEFESAQALIALSTSSSDLSALTSSVNSLRQQQLANTSWSNDVYTTALVIRALALFDARIAQANQTPTASVTGTVVLSGTTIPVNQATIRLKGPAIATVQTNSMGVFAVTGLAAGTYTLVVEKTGYNGVSKVLQLNTAQSIDVGPLPVSFDANMASMQGYVYSGSDHTALANTTVQLTGTLNYQFVTDASGYFANHSIQPGTYTISFARQGYNPESYSITLTGGNLATLRQVLVPTGAFLDSSAADLTGTVIDGLTGKALVGASVQLNGGLSVITDGNGQFRLSGVARGLHQIQFSASGYVGQTTLFHFTNGASPNLGTLLLYPVQAITQPTTLTLKGTVLDGLNNKPVANATVLVVETGTSFTTDALGQFTATAITLKQFNLAISATGFDARTVSVQVSAFGEVASNFLLSPTVVSDPNITTSTLTGTVRDGATTQVIANATVQIPGTGFTIKTDAQGQYQLAGITLLEFDLEASATYYATQKLHVRLSTHSVYTLNLDLQANSAAQDRFQVVSVQAPPSVKGNQTILIKATLVNLKTTTDTATIVGTVVDGNGKEVATLTPYAVGTTTIQSTFDFNPQQELTLELPWNVALNAPGNYQIIIRAVEPGSINRSLTTGIVLAKGSVNLNVEQTLAISAILFLDPPLTQVGSTTPITLQALVSNDSNVALSNESIQLNIKDPNTGNVLHSVNAVLDYLPSGNHKLLQFGTWLPTRTGNIPVQVFATNTNIVSQGTGNIYVGDKASGTFAVEKTVVPEGTSSIRSLVTLNGVDTTTGVSSDPLFQAVKKALETSGQFVANKSVAWQKTNRCLGCHIQSQSLVGLSSASGKANIDIHATNTIFNAFTTSQQDDGGLRTSYPGYTKVQTSLGIWGLSHWKDKTESYRTLYKAVSHSYDRRNTDGVRTWFVTDNIPNGWWYPDEVQTALVLMGISDVLNASQTIDTSQFKDYTLTTLFNIGAIAADPKDIEVGADNKIYIVTFSGVVFSYDPASGIARTVASNLPNQSTGLAIAPDGTIFVSGIGYVIKILPDGSRSTIANGVGYIADVEYGADGYLYCTDLTGHRILKMDSMGGYQVIASGGLLSQPYGLKRTANGDLYIANYNGFNILRMDVSGAITVFADGLSYRPISITEDINGGFLYTSEFNSSNGQNTPNAINRVRMNGTVERLVSYNGLVGIVNWNGRIFTVSNSQNHLLHELGSTSFNPQKLQAFRAEIPLIAEYYLAVYQDGNPQNHIQAMRLIGLAEARKFIQDPALAARIDDAVKYYSNLFRVRQHADGGWGQYDVNPSDSMTTALVGIALEYTNPSVDDPAIRASIQYLLNQQSSDYSWPTGYRLTTKLASTSLVMAYLPKALDRLGGIDIDLHITTPANVQLNNESLPVTATTTQTNGAMHRHWNLIGVTGNGRTINFDLSLQNMQLNELRAVAESAYIEFKNSFTNEILRVDLTIPTVKATSELALGVSTDRPAYNANEDVQIQAVVSNTAPVVSNGTVQLSIRSAVSKAVIATLPAQPFSNLATGGQVTVNASWNTATQWVGGYEVYGQLYDANGRLVNESAAPFSILQNGVAAGAALSTDKPEYQAWDTVYLQGRLTNISANMILPNTFIELTVKDPLGNILYYDTRTQGEIVPQGLRDLPFSLLLKDAMGGQYQAELKISNAFDRTPLTSATTSFMVVRQTLSNIVGTMSATPRVLYQGDTATCSDLVTNRSATDLQNVTLVRKLISQANGVTLSSQSSITTLTTGLQYQNSTGFDTQALALGVYYCMLEATYNGVTSPLAAAAFEVKQPPIRIDTQIELKGHGRLLVYLKDPCTADKSEDDDDDGHHDDRSDDDSHHQEGCSSSSHDDDDHHYYSSSTSSTTLAAAYAARKAYLEGLLNRSGWLYTIATTPKAFAQAVHSGQYSVYAVFNELKDSDHSDIKAELTEIVNRGEGLLVVNLEDDPEAALGIDDEKKGKATGITLTQSPLSTGGSLAFSGNIMVAPVTLQGATAVASFTQLQLYQTEGSIPTSAITLHAYGQGRGIYIGFDILNEAQLGVAGNAFEKILLNALEHINPATPISRKGSVVPVKIQLANQGIAVNGQVQLTLGTHVEILPSEGITLTDPHHASWNYSLIEAQTLDRVVWVKLLSDQPATITATVLTGTGTPVTYDTKAISIPVLPTPTFEAIKTSLSQYANGDSQYAKVLRYVNNAINAFNNNDFKGAHYQLLRATEKLAKRTDAPAQTIRLDIDWLIREIATQL